MTRLLALTLSAALLALSGCGTLMSDSAPYSGVCLDAKVVAQGVPLGLGAWTGDVTEASFWPLAVLDLPFSVIGDTLLLPLTLTVNRATRSVEQPDQKTP